MKDNWKGIEEALTSTCREVLGRNKHHHKKWISMETLDKTQEGKDKNTSINNDRKRTEKIKAHAEYTKANKRVKKRIRADKQKQLGELATTAEKASREGNTRQLYDTTKKLAGKYGKLGQSVKETKGKSATEIDEQKNR
ncbi:unnamed protein product [Schistosoma mattheei]|uniref:Uncharacterized protein n=1 Tax=Schistosoma mattheei TaxID=31246 RepID=A0A183NX52_9TREM|nr:unnamed protein product [Schistosoma mattheei]